MPKKPTAEELSAELQRLRLENQKLKAAPSTTIKVSEKGGLSVYGLGRFPVTLYREQWERLLAMESQILGFIAEHDSDLKRKGE